MILILLMFALIVFSFNIFTRGKASVIVNIISISIIEIDVIIIVICGISYNFFSEGIKITEEKYELLPMTFSNNVSSYEMYLLKVSEDDYVVYYDDKDEIYYKSYTLNEDKIHESDGVTPYIVKSRFERRVNNDIIYMLSYPFFVESYSEYEIYVDPELMYKMSFELDHISFSEMS